MAQQHKKAPHATRRPADIPASQRTSGHLLWALLVAVFGAMIGYFAAANGVAGAVVGGVLGSALGWFLGTRMEKDAGAR